MAPLFSCMSNEIVIRRSCGLLFIVMTLLVSNSNQHPWPHGYELIYATDETTELTGSITMTCRSSSTAENVPLNEVQFWLNGSTCNTNGTSLRERTNVNVLEVDKYRIKFNLTRDLEGYYTCGTRIDENCVTSSQRELICRCIQ